MVLNSREANLLATATASELVDAAVELCRRWACGDGQGGSICEERVDVHIVACLVSGLVVHGRQQVGYLRSRDASYVGTSEHMGHGKQGPDIKQVESPEGPGP